MQHIQSYGDLIVWQKAIDITVAVYEVTKAFPAQEKFGLSSQMQRTAVSIAANIAEGYGRGTRNEYVHFLTIAHGSIAELETLFVIVRKLTYCHPDECSKIKTQLCEVGKMLGSLCRKLRIPKHLAPGS